jgi:hypothetical protein
MSYLRGHLVLEMLQTFRRITESSCTIPEISVTVPRSTWRNILEYMNLKHHRCENLKTVELPLTAVLCRETGGGGSITGGATCGGVAAWHDRSIACPLFFSVLYYIFVVYFTALPVRLDLRSFGMLRSLH